MRQVFDQEKQEYYHVDIDKVISQETYAGMSQTST